jgi:glutathione S-transferase
MATQNFRGEPHSLDRRTMMSQFIVHSIPGSPYGRAVFAALEEKGARYRLAPVPPGTLKSEPHTSRHPFGRVPVLDHDGFQLYETQAILRYLDRVLPSPALTLADPKAAGRMDQLMNVCDWYLFQGVANVIGFQRVVKPRLMGQPPDESAIAQATPKAHAVFEELSRLLGSQAYFVGDEVTLADLMIAPQLDFFSLTPEWAPLTAQRANLSAWLSRMSDRASMKATTWERIAQLAAA